MTKLGFRYEASSYRPVFFALAACAWLTLASRSDDADARGEGLVRLAYFLTPLLAPTFLLNVALILFSWQHYRKLREQAEERARSTAQTRHLTMRDPLTGLHNRRSLSENGAELLANANQRGRRMAMLLLDIDHFKKINDIHGHAVGDGMLRSAAVEITRLVPPGAILSRLGGDEFACAFEIGPDDPGTVHNIAENILACLGQPLTADGTLVQSSVSIGISMSGPDCDTVDQVLRRADIAMYVAKQRGRNGVTWFDTSMERALKHRSDLETKMRHGIPAGEFEPYFEQQIDLATGRLSGFEVLARWNHPVLGHIAPAHFIPVAEETGLIGSLCFSVIRKALTDARDWDPSLSLSINISPLQLRDPWLAQKLVKLLVETSFPSHRLEIEITETGIFDNLPLAQSTIGSLKNQGIRLVLDDFGTGYSSLAHLRALPFDRIKIDKSFVMSLEDNPESAAIVNAIARLGDTLSLPITAEGVERREVEDRLRDMGINKTQGWLYGKPLSLPEVHRLLAERRLLPAPAAHMVLTGDAAVRRLA